jgi:hypothetical protein
MQSIKQAPKSDLDRELSLFCGKVGDAWRVDVGSGWVPGCLRIWFDENGEAYPVYLDLEELDRQMHDSGVEYEKTESPIGGYELTAKGPAATVLAVWLTKSFASGRKAISVCNDNSQTEQLGNDSLVPDC